MRRLIAIFCVAALAFSAAACSRQTEAPASSAASSAEEPSTSEQAEQEAPAETEAENGYPVTVVT